MNNDYEDKNLPAGLCVHGWVLKVPNIYLLEVIDVISCRYTSPLIPSHLNPNTANPYMVTFSDKAQLPSLLLCRTW